MSRNTSMVSVVARSHVQAASIAKTLTLDTTEANAILNRLANILNSVELLCGQLEDACSEREPFAVLTAVEACLESARSLTDDAIGSIARAKKAAEVSP